ncbi:hypothetical protein B0H16DRAFT_1897970 [Mycena metata]|uniref:Uncharacterized protein n=1 Tax=Mycena metata TaxID=1033252 RepID=A0AAD7MHR6_9AGAR|nr:hypothetical protein B0H16DRAFT_1897970 [Mycena metata]
MLVLPIYSLGFALSTAQAIFGWVLSSRTPNEPAPILGEERPWTYHEVIGVMSCFSTLTCRTWILLFFLFCRSKRYLPFVGAGWHANATLFLAGGRLFFLIFGLLLAFHSVKSPIFTALASSCTAVGFRAHACAPLGMLAFLPIAEIFTFICASVIIRRLGVVRYGSAMVQLPVPPPPPPPPPQYAAAWAIVGVVELDKPVISAQLGVPLAAPRAGFGFGF